MLLVLLCLRLGRSEDSSVLLYYGMLGLLYGPSELLELFFHFPFKRNLNFVLAGNQTGSLIKAVNQLSLSDIDAQNWENFVLKLRIIKTRPQTLDQSVPC